MNFFITDALAEGAAPGPAGGTFELIFPLLLMFAIFYFLLIRPQQKKAKQHKAMIAALKEGNEIITNGGIYAKIVGVEESFYVCEIAENTQIRLQSHAVSAILPDGTIK